MEKLNHMMQNEMDVQLAPLSNITGVEIKGGNGYVTFGVTPDVAKRLLFEDNAFVGGFIVADREQFETLDDNS
jgi:hypothetical protein